MAKQKCNHVALADFEIKVQEIISLIFGLCEQELRSLRQQGAQVYILKRNALPFAALSVKKTASKHSWLPSKQNLKTPHPGAYKRKRRSFSCALSEANKQPAEQDRNVTAEGGYIPVLSSRLFARC